MAMRIIAGVAGGRRIVAPDTAGTRPATDRVREAVFSSIAAHIPQACVVDLYAGSGSFGLEALSRGAESAVFVENGSKALRALRANVDSLGLGGEVVQSTVRRFLEADDRKFDVIFIDPPWPMSTREMDTDLSLLDPLVSAGGIVVASRRHTDSIPSEPKSWRVAANKRYGDTRILRYEKEQVEV